MELLMGMPAGKQDKEGMFPENSVFGKVAERMEVWREAEKDDEDDELLLDEELDELPAFNSFFDLSIF